MSLDRSNPHLEVVVQGLTFAESVRWYRGSLYFSDFYSHRVFRVGEGGSLETVCEVPGQPSGLGWLPDGRLLVVSMTDRRLLRLEADGSLALHADLSGVATFHCNDMVVDCTGRAYVGNFGYDLLGGAAPVTASMVRVDPDGAVCTVADGLKFPNGVVITPDQSELIVAESMARQLTSFVIGGDGSLSGRQVWAGLGRAIPDGICLDEEGCIWLADPPGSQAIRVRRGGEVVARIATDTPCISVGLGGPGRRRLYLACSPSLVEADAVRLRGGKILVTDAPAAGAGWP